jgi:3-oxoacyl-[acyl-carrier protein] reductase
MQRRGASAGSTFWWRKDIPIEKLSERDWDEMMETNLKSVYGVIRYAVPVMKKQGGGRIIPISSTAGQRGEAFHDHYAATKGAIISLVKGLSTELAPHGILVNCVAPGWVDTDMSKPVARRQRLPGPSFFLLPTWQLL